MRKALWVGTVVILGIILVVGMTGCDDAPEYYGKQRRQTELLLNEAERQVGMPNIKNFQMRRLYKLILEEQDRADRVTCAYLYNHYTGKWVFIGLSIGFGVPYSAQYTSPEQAVRINDVIVKLPMPDPNGLYIPPTSSATWIILIDPLTGDLNLVYTEPLLTISEKPLPARVVEGYPENFLANYYKGKYHFTEEQINEMLNKAFNKQ